MRNESHALISVVKDVFPLSLIVAGICLQVRFEDAIAVGAKLCVTSTDGGDYLGIDLKRTTLLPEVFETRGFAGQTQGGSWKLSHPESAASRQRSFTKHFKVRYFHRT